MYAESLVAQRLTEKGHTVEFHGPPFDLLVDEKHKVEVKSGKLWTLHASAKFGLGKQIRGKKFDYCVFVMIDRNSLEPLKFLVFSRQELEDCLTPRPRMGKKNNPCILFFYKKIEDLVEKAEKSGEPVLEIERKLHRTPEEFADRWDKIKD